MSAGFKTITPTQLANLHRAAKSGVIEWNGVRVFFALMEWQAIREAAGRVRRNAGKKPAEGRFEIKELATLTGLNERAAKKAVSALSRAGLLKLTPTVQLTTTIQPGANVDGFRCSRSSKRPIPIPRRLLRFWATSRHQALVWTMLGYVLRGLSLSRTGEFKQSGRVKTGWIAETLELSERSVRYAQAELQRTGWIEKDRRSHQNQLNRHGAFFTIDTTWSPKPPLVQPRKESSKVAPRTAEKSCNFAPLINNKKTSTNHDYQKTPGESSNGVFEKNSGKPTLKRIVQEDLFRLDRLEILFKEAVHIGVLQSGEASALNFVSAAVRAREARGDAPRIFAGILRRGLWNHITQAQEDFARRALSRWKAGNQARFTA